MMMQRQFRLNSMIAGLLPVFALSLAACVDSIPTASSGCDMLVVDNLKDTYVVGDVEPINVQLGSRNGMAYPCPNVSLMVFKFSTTDARVVTFSATSLIAAGIGTATVSISGGNFLAITKTVRVVSRVTPP